MRRTQVCLTDLIELAAAAPCSGTGACGCHGAGRMPPKCFYWNEIVLLFLGREPEADQAEEYLREMLLEDGAEPRYIAYSGLMEAGERVSLATTGALASFQMEADNVEVIEKYLDRRAITRITRRHHDLNEAEARLRAMLTDPQSETRRRAAYTALHACTVVLMVETIDVMHTFEADQANRELIAMVEAEHADLRG